MGKINIQDLPEEQEISKEELKKVFGGALVLNPNIGTFSRRIFGRPVFMEKNDSEENIFF